MSNSHSPRIGRVNSSSNGMHEDFKFNAKRKKASRKAGGLARRARRRNKLHRRGS